MKTLTFNDTQLESLKTMNSYILDNEEDHFNECLEDDTYPEWVINHIYVHALKLNEILNNV
jgi:hypothetical protein